MCVFNKSDVIFILYLEFLFNLNYFFWVIFFKFEVLIIIIKWCYFGVVLFFFSVYRFWIVCIVFWIRIVCIVFWIRVVCIVFWISVLFCCWIVVEIVWNFLIVWIIIGWLWRIIRDFSCFEMWIICIDIFII